MKRWLLILAVAAAHAQTVTETLFPGVTHIRHTESYPRKLSIHVIVADLQQPGLRFHLTPHEGSRETVRQTTLEFLKSEHAQVAINAHFFLPYPSDDREAFLVGLAASDGNVYSDFESPEQSYALLKNAPALNIDRVNHASIVHRGEPAQWFTAVSGSAQIVTSGRKTIPTYGDGDLTPSSPYSNQDSWYERVNARTAIGVTRDGRRLILFTVDRAGASQGMTVGEVADFLISNYDVWDALNLDGGGSTALAVEGQGLVNTPSDSGGRAVGSNLGLFVTK